MTPLGAFGIGVAVGVLLCCSTLVGIFLYTARWPD